MAKTKKKKISAIDLFCGAGGLTHGFLLEGIDVRVGIDIDEGCQYPYTQNNVNSVFLKRSVAEVDGAELSTYFRENEIRILAGCAPCQPFSTFRHTYDKKKKKAIAQGIEVEEVDERWSLLGEFGRIAEELGPNIITMENVPKLLSHSIFGEFVAKLESLGYYVTKKSVDCSKYGLPQKRRRLVLFASKKGEIEFPETDILYKEKKTVEDVIGGLPFLEAGKQCEDDPLHKARNLAPINKKRILASTPGGTWRDWDKSLLPDCYKVDTGATFQSVYGRMEWEEPSPTITTQFFGYGTGRFGHPTQNRALSLREGALLQTFPPTYKFAPEDDPLAFNRVGQWIGNAVPVDLGRIIALTIKNHISKYEW